LRAIGRMRHLRKFFPQRGTACPFRSPVQRGEHQRFRCAILRDLAPSFDHRPDLLRNWDRCLALLRLEPTAEELPLICGSIGLKCFASPRLPLQPHDLAGARTTEDTDLKETEIVQVLNGIDQAQNLVLRHHRFFNWLGLRHRHVFSRSWIGHANETSLGISLYITREIIQAHKGVIHVDSSDGEGTTFTFRLPRC
jgi:hypothetical protein